ncbi:MAG: hybrid sensor histidine kinase/response regulator, partial [Haliea sp.]
MNRDEQRKVPGFLHGGGQLAGLIANLDWAATPIGPIDSWDPSLRATVSLILQSTVPIVTLWGEQGVMIYNDAYAVFAGGRHPQLLGSNVREGWPEVADFNDHVMKTCLAGGTLAYQDQQLTLNRSGSMQPGWMNLDYSAVRDQDGIPIGVMAIVVETTAKVKAEEAVRASEAQFRAFAQAMPNHVWAAAPDGMLDWFNDRVYGYSGAQTGQLNGQAWTDMVHPDDVEAAGQKWAHSLQSGNTYEAEFRLRRADGSYRWHIARAEPIRNAAGEVGRWVGTNTDIEDQKATARALADLNHNLEAQVASRTEERDRMWRLSTDIMLVADFESRIVSTNPAWTRSLGWAPTEMAGRSFMDLVHPADRAATLAEVGSLGAGITTLKFENRYQRKDGSYCTLSWTAVPDQGLIHAVGRDVTADRESAEALRQAELALYQAQKMETVGKLTGGVAHDFNNLLQVVAGNLHLLSKAVAGNERAERQVANALAGVGRGAKLSSQLLAFARRQPLEPKVINLGKLVHGMEDMLQRSLGEEIEMETVASGGLWNTCIDPAQVENAILNLAINARDAMDGNGRLTLEVGNALLDETYGMSHADVKPGQYVVLAVSDTGKGMPEEVMAQAFEPFFSTKPEGKGTGLGLSMVYGFVKQSGGHVKLYSEPGHGTTVKLYLPRTLQKADALPAVDFEPVTGGTETILVAEDDDAVRATVIDILGDLGYRILKANDAASALAIIESGVPIDLLFTDVVMPGTLRSPELARRARELLPDIAVLFTSGYTENAIVHGGRLDAGVDLIGKPYTQDALARKIRYVLANQRQRNHYARTGPVVAD